MPEANAEGAIFFSSRMHNDIVMNKARYCFWIPPLLPSKEEVSPLAPSPIQFQKNPRKTNQAWKAMRARAGTPRLCEALAECLKLVQNRSVRLGLELPRTRSVRITPVSVQNRFVQS